MSKPIALELLTFVDTLSAVKQRENCEPIGAHSHSKICENSQQNLTNLQQNLQNYYGGLPANRQITGNKSLAPAVVCGGVSARSRARDLGSIRGNPWSTRLSAPEPARSVGSGGIFGAVELIARLFISRRDTQSDVEHRLQDLAPGLHIQKSPFVENPRSTFTARRSAGLLFAPTPTPRIDCNSVVPRWNHRGRAPTPTPRIDCNCKI